MSTFQKSRKSSKQKILQKTAHIQRVTAERLLGTCGQMQLVGCIKGPHDLVGQEHALLDLVPNGSVSISIVLKARLHAGFVIKNFQAGTQTTGIWNSKGSGKTCPKYTKKSETRKCQSGSLVRNFTSKFLHGWADAHFQSAGPTPQPLAVRTASASCKISFLNIYKWDRGSKSKRQLASCSHDTEHTDEASFQVCLTGQEISRTCI